MEAVSTCGQPAVNPAHPAPPARYLSRNIHGGWGEGSEGGGASALQNTMCTMQAEGHPQSCRARKRIVEITPCFLTVVRKCPPPVYCEKILWLDTK
jgi:hypothetical protein